MLFCSCVFQPFSIAVTSLIEERVNLRSFRFGFALVWFVCFLFLSELFSVLPCVILFLWFFSPFSIAITSLGEERVNLSACLFPLPLGDWEGCG